MDNPFIKGFTDVFKKRKEEANEYYAAILPHGMSEDMAQLQRQALAVCSGVNNTIILMWKHG